MGQIYQNAYVTIAATHARNGTEGLHAEPRPRLMARSLLSRDLYVGHKTWLPQIGGGEYSNEKFPLLSRGWVLQERLLSPRMVHFLDNMVVWECPSGVKAEDRLTFLPRETKSLPFSNDECSSEDLIALWHTIVTHCSQSLFTFEDDRLPAIAALAQRMLLLRPGDEYLAGLWKSTLLDDLTWEPGAKSKRTKSTIWKAPTWSWVSGSYVEFTNLGALIPTISLVDVFYRQNGPVHLGQILDASITIEAQIVTFHCKAALPPETCFYGVKFSHPGSDVNLETTFNLNEIALDDPDLVSSDAPDGVTELRPDEGLGDDLTLHFLPLRYTLHYFIGLILRKVSSRTYERIGFMIVSHSNFDRNFFEYGIWNSVKHILSPWPMTTVKII